MKTILNSDFYSTWAYMPFVKNCLAPDGLMAQIKETKPSNRVLDLRYRGVSVAIFRHHVDAKTKEVTETDKDVKKRAEEWVRTHGHLAEWMRTKYMTNAIPNWDDSMRISPVWTETILKVFPSRKEASAFYWSPEYVDIVYNQYKAPRYSAFIYETKLILIDHFPK